MSPNDFSQRRSRRLQEQRSYFIITKFNFILIINKLKRKLLKFFLQLLFDIHRYISEAYVCKLSYEIVHVQSKKLGAVF